MRKLTKKISMLMVLAMLVGLFSGVVSASAASKWSFKSNDLDVAVGATVNLDQNQYENFDLYKSGVLADEATYTITWESSDEKVVWVNAKTGQLRAKKDAADGAEAVITANIVNNDTKGTHAVSFTIVVGEVKVPVYTLQAPAFEEAVEVGTELKFSTNVLDEEGKAVSFKECGLYRAYFLNGEAVATTWTAEKAGEYTFTVGAFKAKADMADLANAVDKAEFTVVVAPDNTFVIKQASMTSFTMTFGEGKDLSKVTKDDIAVAEAASIDGAKITVPVKELNIKDNVITVNLYQDLAKDTYVFAKFLDGEYCGFKVAKGDVKSIAVSSKAVMINEYTALDIKLFDENEIDITATADLSRVTVEVVAGKDNCAISDKSILFWEDGKAVQVVATYHTYDYLTNNDGTEVVYKSEAATISSVKEQKTYSAVDGWAIANAGSDQTKLTYAATTSIALDDAGKKLYGKLVETKVTTKTETKTVYTGDLGYTFASADTEKLLVLADGTLIPVAQGTVDVLLKDGEGKIKSVATVTILPKRAADSIALAPSKTTMSTVAADKIEVTVTVKDQYGDKWPVAAVDVKDASTKAAFAGTGSINFNAEDGKITFQNFAAGSYTFSVEVEKKIAYVSFKVQAPEAAATYKLEANKTSISTNIASDTNKAFGAIYGDATISIGTYDKYGYRTADVKVVADKIDSPAVAAVTGTVVADGFYVVLNGPDGYKDWLSVNTGNVVLKGVKVGNGNAISKAPAGTYTVTLYKSAAVGNTGKVSFAYCDSITLTVVDGQPAYTAKLVKNSHDTVTAAAVISGASVEVVIDDCFEIKNAKGEVQNLDGYRDLEQKNADKVVVFISVKFDEKFDFSNGSYYVEQKINLLTSPITLK